MILAAIPRTVRLGLEPSVPGLPGIYLLAVAVFVAALAGAIFPYCGKQVKEKFGRAVCPILIGIGVLATLALVAAELYVALNGWDSFAYRRHGQLLVFVEFCCGLLSLLGWMVAQPKADAYCAPEYAFAFGAGYPFVLTLLSALLVFEETSILLCALSAALVGSGLVILHLRGRLSDDFAALYVAGQLFFSSVWWGHWVYEPILSTILAGVLALGLVATIVKLLVGECLGRRLAGREKSSPKRALTSMDAVLESMRGSDRLSPRERQVAMLTLEGKTDIKIAEELGISKSSVASLRRRGYLKLGVSGKRDLLEKAGAAATDHEDDTLQPDLSFAIVGLARLIAIIVPLALLAISGPDFTAAYAGWDGYVARGVAALILVLACFPSGGRLASATRRDERSVSLALAKMVCALMFAYGARAAVGPTYVKVPCWYAIAALIMLLVVQGFESDESACRKAWTPASILSAGLMELARPDTCCSLLAASGMLLFDYAGYRFGAPGVAEGLPGIAEALLIVSAALCVRVVAENCVSNTDDDLLFAAEEDKAILYLRARGLSEVQARAVSLLASGASARQVCERCFISPGSLGTFRTRAYKKLGVNTMDDLRILLEREVDFPKRDKPSPVK